MSLTLRVTYDVVTPESAELGDVADSGFYHRGGWQTPADDPSSWSLHDVVSEFGRGTFEDGGHGFYSADSHENYQTGEHTSFAVHPPDTITAASYRRLARLLCERPKRRTS